MWPVGGTFSPDVSDVQHAQTQWVYEQVCWMMGVTAYMQRRVCRAFYFQLLLPFLSVAEVHAGSPVSPGGPSLLGLGDDYFQMAAVGPTLLSTDRL